MDEYIKCPFCGQEVKKGNCHHFKKCRVEYLNSLSEEKKNDIIDKYTKDGYSMLEMSEYLKLPYSATQRILKELGYNRRSIKEACNLPRKKEKYENTCEEHFGYRHNFIKESPSRKKWEDRLLKEEGINNVFQRKEVILKIKKTLEERYTEEERRYNYSKGITLEYWVEKLGEEKGKEKYESIIESKRKPNKVEYYIEKYGDNWEEKWNQRWIRKFKTRVSKLNEKCADILKKNNIEFEQEFKIKKENGYFYSYDFKINNLLLELNGTYWHCSPKIYKPNDLVKFPNNVFILAKDKWAYDLEKTEQAKKYDYKCVTIWEDEFNEDVLLKILEENNYGKISQN